MECQPARLGKAIWSMLKRNVRACELSLNSDLLLPSTHTVRKGITRLLFSAPLPQYLHASRDVCADTFSLQAKLACLLHCLVFAFFFPSKVYNLGRVPCLCVWFFDSSFISNVTLFPPLVHSASRNFFKVVMWTLPLFFPH